MRSGSATKDLGACKQAFRCFKTVDLKVRPIHHRLEGRVRAHVFLCMLAYYLEWHMRKALAPSSAMRPHASRAKMSSARRNHPQTNPKARTKKTLMAPRFTLFKPYWLIYRPSFETPSPRILRVLRLGNRQNPRPFTEQRAFDLLKNVPTA